MVSPLVANLPELRCRKVYYVRDDTIYSYRFTAGKKRFLCTLNIVNPPAKHVAISSLGIKDPLFILEGGPYSFNFGLSRKALPKVEAKPAEQSVNAVFLNYTVQGSNLRWANIEQPQKETGIGYIENASADSPARLVGVYLIGTTIKLVDVRNKIMKLLTVTPGGVHGD